MNSNDHSDHFYISLDWDDDSSAESDSGISSISSDSISSQFSQEDHSFISTMFSIAKDISLQSPVYSKALIDFTLSGLTCSDVFIRRSAAVFMWQLFRACNMPYYDSIETKEKMTLLLKISDNIVESLEIALKIDSYSSQMLYWVSGCFHYISRTHVGCNQLLKGNICILVSMLSCDLQAVVYYSITAIHNILLTSPCPFVGDNLTSCVNNILNRIDIYDSLGDTQIKLMAICIDCLSNLAYQNNSIKAQICANSSAIQIIISTLLHNINNEKLLLLGMRLLKILTTIQNTKSTISNSPKFPQLISTMFKSKLKLNSQILLITLCTLRNLSDILFQDDNLLIYNDILVQICDKFQQINRLENDLIFQCAAGILANASCDCPQNKTLLVKMKIHDTILSILSGPKNKFHKWSGDTVEAMYRCLNHLCCSHDKAPKVISKCLRTDAQFLQNISEILSKELLCSSDQLAVTGDIPISWSILRAWLGITRHLCIERISMTQSKYDIKLGNLFAVIKTNLRHFQIQLENVMAMTPPDHMIGRESSENQYLSQLHSSILHIMSINNSPNQSSLDSTS